MDFDMLSVYSLSEWVNEIDKEIETIDTDIQKYSRMLHDEEAIIRVCNANLDKLQKRKEQLKMRSQCLSSLEEEKYGAMEAIDRSDIDISIEGDE